MNDIKVKAEQDLRMKYRLYYLLASLGFCLVIFAARTYELHYGFNENEGQILCRLIAILSVMVCMKREKFEIEFNSRGGDRKTTYAMGIVLFVMGMAYYCPMDKPEALQPNGWLMAYAITAAASNALVFYPIGKFFFTLKKGEIGYREEGMMTASFFVMHMICVLTFFETDSVNLLLGIAMAIGMAVFFTAIYLRYNITGAIIVINFCVLYFPKVFALNSSYDVPVFDERLTIVLVLAAAISMATVGWMTLKEFNTLGEVERIAEPVSYEKDLVDEMREAREEASEKAQKAVMAKMEARMARKEERRALKAAKKHSK